MAANSSPGGSSPDKGKRLRRPHPATQQRLLNGVHDQNQNQGPVMPATMLSVNAPEFVPHYAMVQQHQQPTNPADALNEDFERLVSIRPPHLTGVTTTGLADTQMPEDMFKDAVFHLTSHPANMEDYIKPVVDRLKHLTNPQVLSDIIETLFEQSISEPNFHFTGAKICKYLSNELRTHHLFSGFRGQFLNRCKLEYEKRELLIDTDVTRLCGLGMYIGELFLALEIEVDGHMSRYGILRSVIADLVRLMLTRLDDNLIMCATKLLKLTGTALMETKELSGNFDDIFATIKTLERHPSLNKTSHCLVNSVLSRLECNFGVDQQSSPQKPTSQQNQQSYPASFQQNEPIFYDQNGQTISREEAGFCADDGSDFDENIDAYLQWEAENFVNQELNIQASEQQWANSADNQQWSNADDGQYNTQVPWSTGDVPYPDWSSSNQEDLGYIYPPDENVCYPDEVSTMDDEMMADYELFLRESQQSRKQ